MVVQKTLRIFFKRESVCWVSSLTFLKWGAGKSTLLFKGTLSFFYGKWLLALAVSCKQMKLQVSPSSITSLITKLFLKFIAQLFPLWIQVSRLWSGCLETKYSLSTNVCARFAQAWMTKLFKNREILIVVDWRIFVQLSLYAKLRIPKSFLYASTS